MVGTYVSGCGVRVALIVLMATMSAIMENSDDCDNDNVTISNEEGKDSNM
jgi:hypothetical protein